ncbi:aspartate carbamoyltransferase, catalytic subunit [Campylobacter blaseri]|uniref:Aspartate carbamoyltransferase n=1 Tax=Campylobacter blaseri TaxID=2042961 RepID=A0A2P8QZ66_9BACT|nr:aspartate carbamoyltransferase catalytic subunit [Campylobacter blaseri]PSM51540.1 aspartate carbamoyltransferase [Campylobacter blaseri]PSM53333.1 aspartate carbamoyltransferase [Campylobacter blaseri]QKF86626.1 aspartate carbamoyltransferase, catalytic subunit [Campylobacter blaseri]
MSYKRKDLLGTRDLSSDELMFFLDYAKEFKNLNNQSIKKADNLRGKTVINVFYENSTRTRTSFETAAKRLGADAINFTASQSSTKKGETLIDTIHNMEAMKTDIFVVRHNCSGSVRFIAQNSNACVVNAGDGLNEHPTQALLDLFTIREHKGSFKGLNVSIIGDIEHSRVARSDIWAMKTLGINVTLFGPPMMMPNRVDAFGCRVAKNMEEAVEGADVIIMLRVQLERQGSSTPFPSTREYSKFFGLTKERVKLANKNPLVFHPGPINRGVELNSDVADSECSMVLNQVENGVAVRMAVLSTLIKNRG